LRSTVHRRRNPSRHPPRSDPLRPVSRMRCRKEDAWLCVVDHSNSLGAIGAFHCESAILICCIRCVRWAPALRAVLGFSCSPQSRHQPARGRPRCPRGATPRCPIPTSGVPVHGLLARMR
jgi:hypothetical protein